MSVLDTEGQYGFRSPSGSSRAGRKDAVLPSVRLCSSAVAPKRRSYLGTGMAPKCGLWSTYSFRGALKNTHFKNTKSNIRSHGPEA